MCGLMARQLPVEPDEQNGMDDRIFRRIIQEMNCYVYVCAPDYRITYMNTSLMKKLGRDATGENCHKVIHRLDSPCSFCTFETPESGEPVSWQLTSPLDGHTYNVSAMMFEGADGPMNKITIMRDITSQKIDEEKLKEENRIFEGVVESLPGVFILAAEDMHLICWNRNLLEATGYSTEELTRMKMTDLFHGWEKEYFADKIREALEKGTSAFEIHLCCKTEDRTPYLLRAAVISLKGQKHVILAGNDLSEKYEAEKVLLKLSYAVEQSPVSIVITDTKGTIEYVNPKFCQVTGYFLEEAIGQNPRILKSGSTPDSDYKAMWETITAGNVWQGEFHNRKKNGEKYYELASITPIKNADGVVTHFLAVKEDITERKMMERELHKSQAELVVKHEQMKNYFMQMDKNKKEWENTMDCVDDIIILTDTQCRVKRCNKALSQLTGLNVKEIIGKNWQELLAEHGLSIPSTNASGKEFYHEASDRWFVFHSYPFTDKGTKQVTGAVFTLHDNTIIKQFTTELEKANSDLKSTQAKVIQQEKMASIGQLAAGVAHEINNPMGFISSNLTTLAKYLERLDGFIGAQWELIEMVTDEDASKGLREKRKALKVDYILEDGRDLIKESLDGAERVRTIVQNLKSFSRVDEAECKAADINECMLSTINIVWNEVKYKASLIKELGEIPQVKCHPQQINQVFMNLLVNAAHAIEKQGEITVRTWQEDNSVFASVKDTGCGMTEEVMNRIFEPFYTTKEVGKGTGLGLSITYDIIKNHQGDITVDSEPGAGTTFTVRLPISGCK